MICQGIWWGRVRVSVRVRVGVRVGVRVRVKQMSLVLGRLELTPVVNTLILLVF